MIKALVLAAGKSTRISEVSGSIPKPLLKIRGETILVHNLKLLAEHKIKEVWVNLHYQADLIKKEIGDGKKWGVQVYYSFEKEILGTAGALNPLKQEMAKNMFLVLYGDNFSDCNLSELIANQKKSHGLGTIAVYDPEETLNSGIAGGRVKIDASGAIKNFVEGRMESKNTFVNAGVYAFSPTILNYIPPTFSDFGKDIFPKLLKEGKKLYAYKMKNGYCLGVDTTESYARAQEIVASFPFLKREERQA